eukprot:scaffold70477_cov61-Attheya_sp.AAC.1
MDGQSSQCVFHLCGSWKVSDQTGHRGGVGTGATGNVEGQSGVGRLLGHDGSGVGPQERIENGGRRPQGTGRVQRQHIRVLEALKKATPHRPLLRLFRVRSTIILGRRPILIQNQSTQLIHQLFPRQADLKIHLIY